MTLQVQPQVLGSVLPEYETILSRDALCFIGSLETQFGARRRELLQRREKIQDELNRGILPGFLPETEEVRRGSWKLWLLSPHRRSGW